MRVIKEGGVMGILDDWNTFRRRRPRLAGRIKELGTALYALGADKAQNAPEFQTLKEALQDASADDLQLLGITEFADQQLLRAVFELGGAMLLSAEQCHDH